MMVFVFKVSENATMCRFRYCLGMYKTMQSYELTTYKHDILTTTPQWESITSLLCFLHLSFFLRCVLIRSNGKENNWNFQDSRKVNFLFLEYLCGKKEQIISFVSPFLYFPLHSVSKTGVSWQHFAIFFFFAQGRTKQRKTTVGLTESYTFSLSLNL